MDDLFLFLDFNVTTYYTINTASLEIHVCVIIMTVFPFLIIVTRIW